jgi:toxin YoeB
MRLVFTPSAWEGYLWFQEQNKPLLKRVILPVRDIPRTPFDGIGKPEPSKGELAGYWSRRISEEHRLVYAATATEAVIVACRYHHRL